MRDRLKQQLLSMQARLARLQAEYESAVARFEALEDPPDPLDLALAQAQLDATQAQLADAQRTLEEIRAGPSAGDLAKAQADLDEAQARWERLQNGPDPQEVALAEARLAVAQAKLAQAQSATLVKELAAPIDAKVLSTGATPGDRINGQVILTLADVSQPLLQVHLDEADLDSVRAGYQANVVFDSLPDVTFTGHVVQVDPSLANFGSTAAVRLLVQLDSPGNPALHVPLGANASIDIIAGQAEDAVLVPVEALRQQADGEYYVVVVVDGQLETRPVQVGLMDITTVQITRGLQPGEAVAIGALNAAQE
jgi:RND family efflux transporter MFP subunit